MCFNAVLPDTPFARSIYEAVKAKKITHVCPWYSSADFYMERNRFDERRIYRRADVHALSLLITTPTHATTSWVTIGGPLAEQRIEREAALAEQKHLWALDPNVTAVQTMEPPQA